jgi:chemotaxis regulatin CheY-phosphate phosphatase CheZ
MKTNSKHVKNIIKLHILDSVYDGNENQFKTFEESAKELHNEFKRVANHQFNLKKIPNNIYRFDDYLRGLPYHFLIYNDELKDFLNSLGINEDKKEFTSEKMRFLYAQLIYKEIEKY